MVEVYRTNVQIPRVAQLNEEMKKRDGVCAAAHANQNEIPGVKCASGTRCFRET